MSRWKLFGKSDEVETAETKESSKEEETEEETESVETNEDDSMVEYHETLYSGTSNVKKGTTITNTDQRYWRDVETIEKNIDNIHVTKAKKPHTDVERTVDNLILKKEGK